MDGSQNEAGVRKAPPIGLPFAFITLPGGAVRPAMIVRRHDIPCRGPNEERVDLVVFCHPREDGRDAVSFVESVPYDAAGAEGCWRSALEFAECPPVSGQNLEAYRAEKVREARLANDERERLQGVTNESPPVNTNTNDQASVTQESTPPESAS